nr:hypothetical protein BaRGS_012439 [Batillaria attramentaria]
MGDSGVHGNLTPLELMSAADNQSVAGMFERCRKTARKDPAIKGYLLDREMEACHAASCLVDLPNTYVVYKLGSGAIDIDGKLEERAWKDVAWTEPFVDIRGEGQPEPRFETRVKLRWDDRNLYVGAYLQEYKEVSINALGIVSDIMLTRPYMDDGEPLSFWESDVVRAVHIDGPVNDPSRRS